ncbi:MAG: MBL fold metallo-hydrolase [Eubacteriales bacterium]|nr:MBL fold metallo-hydrolase [Eubacteriales bacterium]
MKITFLGAAKTVTGSCYLVEAAGCRFFVDCGLFQGNSKEVLLNKEPFPINPADLDFVLLTHAHIDHSGRIPKLYKDGFGGTIYSTNATKDLCGIMLPDSGYIQESEAEWLNRKRKRAGKHPVEPVYTYQDALDCLKLFEGIKYGADTELKNGIHFRFRNGGHILGASIIELWIPDEGREVKVVFSGDLGNNGIPIMKDPETIDSADYLLIESTYADRVHKDKNHETERFVNIINETLEKGGNVIIPSFAVGRTQEVIYELNKHKERYSANITEMLFKTPVIIDSPLAISATQVFRNNLECFDEEATEYLRNGDNPLDFPGLVFTRTADESKALNTVKESMIIISASGMCEAGRIKHHLKHNLWRPESTILFVGYQAEGTLGRRLLDGAKKVKIFGEEINVMARIEMIEGLSGHADKEGLFEWIDAFKKKPSKIYIVHGEKKTMSEFALEINAKYGIPAVVPGRGDICSTGAEKSFEKAAPSKPLAAYKKAVITELLENIKESLDSTGEELRDEISGEEMAEYADMVITGLRDMKKMIERFRTVSSGQVKKSRRTR